VQITKSKLKKIIKEEIQTILNEGAVRIPGVNVPEDYVHEPEPDPYAHMRHPVTGRLSTDEEIFGLPPKPESAPFTDVAFEEEHVPPEHKKYLDELELYGKETDYGPEWGKEHGEYWDKYYASEGNWEWDEETNSWDIGFKPDPAAWREEERRFRAGEEARRQREARQARQADIDYNKSIGVDPAPIDPETGLDFELKFGVRCSGGGSVPESGRCAEGELTEPMWMLPKYVKKIKDKWSGKWYLHNEKTGRTLNMPKGI